MKIPPSHMLAQRAILAVSSILNAAGALTEVIKDDYGEDLIVKTHFRDVADDFNVLFQIKGRTIRRHKDGSFKFRFDAAHIQRWVRHIAPVIVCIFDARHDIAFAVPVREQIKMHETFENKKSFIITFTENDLLNKENAIAIIWKCRIEYYTVMIAWSENEHSRWSPQLKNNNPLEDCAPIVL